MLAPNTLTGRLKLLFYLVDCPCQAREIFLACYFTHRWGINLLHFFPKCISVNCKPTTFSGNWTQLVKYIFCNDSNYTWHACLPPFSLSLSLSLPNIYFHISVWKLCKTPEISSKGLIVSTIGLFIGFIPALT